MSLEFKSLGRGVYEARNGPVKFRIERVGKLKSSAAIYDATARTKRRTLIAYNRILSLDEAKRLLITVNATLPCCPAGEVHP